MHITRLALALGGIVGSLSIAACDLDVIDLNNPGLDELEASPNAVSVNAATTGLLIGDRSNKAAPNGYVSQLGILGRESYNFDSADPRFISELIVGQLNSGGPFGENFWANPYTNLKLGHIVLHAVDKVADGELNAEAKAGIRGFTKTLQALDLLEVINTHDTNGAVIDTDHNISDPLPPIVDKATTLTAIADLLDKGATDLGGGGAAFSFLLSEGFKGFDTPKTFLTFNRAIRARVAVYQKEYAVALTALAASFLKDTDPVDFKLGVSYTYTTKSGDVTNGLINPNIYAHASIQTDVQKRGTTADLRLGLKVEAKKAGAAKGYSSAIGFTMYPNPGSSLPLIRNEELILLKAEALFFTQKQAEAITELNIVRTQVGGLDPIPGVLSEAVFIDALLYERRYSLLFEGHRWIDLRRFGKLATLPVDKAEDTRNLRYPIPLTECNARPMTEERCNLGSL